MNDVDQTILLITCSLALAVGIWVIPLYVIWKRKSLFRSVWQSGIVAAFVCALAGVLYSPLINHDMIYYGPFFLAVTLISFLMIFPICLSLRDRDPLTLSFFGSWSKSLKTILIIAAMFAIVAALDVHFASLLFGVLVFAWVLLGICYLLGRILFGIDSFYAWSKRFYKNCHRWPPNRRPG